MRTLFNLFMAVTLANCCYAQKINVNVTAPTETKLGSGGMVRAGNHFIGYEYTGNADHLMHGFGWNKTKMGIDVFMYDTSLHLLKKQSLANGERIYAPMFTDMLEHNGKIYLIYSEVQEKNTLGNVMATEINQETLQADAPFVIGQVAGSGFVLKFSESTQYYFRHDIKHSPDKKNLLLSLYGGPGLFFLSVLDENLKIKWTQSSLFGAKEDITFKSVCVDNEGTVFLAYSNNSKEAEKSNNTKRIAVITQQGKKQEFIPDLGTSWCYSLELLPSAHLNRTVHVAGIYLEDKDNESIRGVFSATLQTDKLVLSKPEKIDFPDSTVAIFDKDGWGNTKRKKYGLDRGFAPTLFEYSDGKPGLVGEFANEINSLQTRAVFSRFGNILVVHFNGSNTSFTRIPKYRVSTASLVGASYASAMVNDRLMVFYNDKEENLTKDLMESPVRSDVYKNLVLVAATVLPDGRMRREKIVDLKEEHFLTLTDMPVRIGDDRLAFPLVKIKGLGGLEEVYRMATVWFQ